MTKLWLATSNSGKIREIQQILEGAGIEIHTPNELSFYATPPESGKTFEENAKIKAKSLHSVVPNDWVLADDSGLEVEGLGGLPGIHSARYAGEKARDFENTSKLLKMMALKSATNRQAKFRCVMVLRGPGGKEMVFEGELAGEITKGMRGTGGFGYDPVFQPTGEQRTLAEMTAADKNRISHRYIALKKVREFFKNSIELNA
jgi:XTP/dITP diphosphohydrolase